jgi:hypothetical protein
MKFKDPNGTSYEPRNWDDGYKGINYTARQALRDSRNIPAIQVISIIGVEAYLNVAKEFGYTSYTASYGPSIILGGGSVYPYEHAQGYGIFANGGDLVTLNPIMKIVDKKGNTIYEATPEKKTVGDPQGIFLLNQTIMNYDEYSWDGRELAGKTGTTESNIDAWYMGYTPDMVTVCWSGNNNNDPMAGDAYPINIVHPWCKELMREIGSSKYFTAKTPFARPGNILNSGGDCNAAGECLGLNPDWMIADRVPPRDVFKKVVTVCTDQKDKLARDIDRQLGYAVDYTVTIYKNPIEDIQNQLNAYLRGSGNLDKVPTEYCTADRSNGTSGPFFGISAPGNGTTVGNSINIKGGVFVNGSTITDLSFSIDGQDIPSCTTTNYNNFDITCDISSLGLGNGSYNFRAHATDALNRSNSSSSVSIVVNSEVNGNITASVSGGPNCNGGCNRVITANVSGGSGISSPYRLYQIKNGGAATLLGNMPVGIYNWNTGNPGAGVVDKYVFYIVADIGNNGSTRSANSSELTVTGN